jgi:hypothetical protein
MVGVSIWACSSSSPNTGFGNPSNSNGGNGSSNNGNSSNGQTYGGGGTSTNNNTGFGNTTNNNTGGGNTTANNTGGGNTTTAGGTTTAAGGQTGCPAASGAYTTSTSCSAAKASGALALSNCFYTSANPSAMGQGYGYVFGDGTSTVCLDSTNLCGAGSTAKADAAFTLYGSGFGVNLNQSSGGVSSGTVTPTASGLTWAITAATAPTYGLQIVIVANSGPCSTASGCCFRPPAGTTSGMTPWSMFTTACYNPAEAGAGFTSSDGIDKINFQAISSTAGPGPFDFCVTSLSY